MSQTAGLLVHERRLSYVLLSNFETINEEEMSELNEEPNLACRVRKMGGWWLRGKSSIASRLCVRNV